MNIKELMINFHGEEPDMGAEYEIDMILNNVADSADEMHKMVWNIPHERLYEAERIVDDAISQLILVKTKLEGRKV